MEYQLFLLQNSVIAVLFLRQFESTTTTKKQDEHLEQKIQIHFLFTDHCIQYVPARLKKQLAFSDSITEAFKVIKRACSW